MKFKLTSCGGSLALPLVLLVLLFISAYLVSAEQVIERVKRQSTRSSALSLSSASSTSLDGSVPSQPGEFIKTDKNTGNVRPQVSAVDSRDELDGELDKPQVRPVKRRRPKVTKRPLPAEQPDRERDYEDETDADCDDDYLYQRRGGFNPMRQFKSMMNRMLDHMAPAYDGFDDQSMRSSGGRGSLAAAAASSFSGGSDGYSRQSSSVTNNGRTRGIISETRNGRTRTRQFGDSPGEDEEES